MPYEIEVPLGSDHWMSVSREFQKWFMENRWGAKGKAWRTFGHGKVGDRLRMRTKAMKKYKRYEYYDD